MAGTSLSKSICQCEVGDLGRGLCGGSASINGNVVHLGVESEFAACLGFSYLPHWPLGRVYSCLERTLSPLVALMLVELWVWGEVI